jgi:hypothetical protein
MNEALAIGGRSANGESSMTRYTALLAAAAFLAAATSAPAAQLGIVHDYSHVASSLQGTQAVSKCHRVCVKTISHGPAAAPECVKWEMIC